MRVIYDQSRQRVPIKCWADDADADALRQAVNVASLPVAFDHVALMADAHVGFGMPIGGVAAIQEAVIPYAVGMDIGCGMSAWRTGVTRGKIQDHLEPIIGAIRQRIPTGFEHRTPTAGRKLVEAHCPELLDLLAGTDPSKAFLSGHAKIIEQIGTLGGGNHFIEAQVDEEGGIWLMLHSGSRNVGKVICDHFHRTAKQVCQRAGVEVADPALSYLPIDSLEGKAYLAHMTFAQEFARWNRHVMMRICQEAVTRSPIGGDVTGIEDIINIHHNYAAEEEHAGRRVWVHRKGATSARRGQLGIIPGSMGTSSYIVRGLGNPESFVSCSHGAGRVMGRKEAKRKISMDRFKQTMKGIQFKVSPRHLDEAPDAYKDIDRVMTNQRDLVEVVHKLRPLAVVKG
ncbi:MAG: RtcB family protein [Phycisphaerae bacterium]|nr:RtcB family protein [Phycisphaerae bacterium]